MFPRLIASTVLNTIQAAAADVAISNDKVSFTGLGINIPLRNILQSGGYTKIPAAAGTPKQMTYTFTDVDPSTNYVLTLSKYPAGGENIQRPFTTIAGDERYAIQSDATATVTEVAAAFAAAITKAASANASFFTATSSAGVLTVVANSAASDFMITLQQTIALDGNSVGTAAVSVAWVPTNGTYAQVAAVNPLATSGSTYDTYIFKYFKPAGEDLVSPLKEGFFNAQVNVYLKVGATNLAALETEIAAIANGTHSPSTDYLGIYA